MNEFSLIYHDRKYLVDPAFFAINSKKFREIYNPAYAHLSQITISGNYQDQSVSIFCQLCQDKEVKIPDANMKDIANLAKLFDSEAILETALRIIHAKLDGGFKPDDKGSCVYEPKNLAQTGAFTSSRALLSTQISAPPSKFHNRQMSFSKSQPLMQATEPPVQVASSQQATENPSYYLEKPVIYEIQHEKKKMMKAPKYHMILNNEVLLTGKTRSSNIVINTGTDAHFEDIEKSTCEIQRNNLKNTIRVDNDLYTLKFFRDPDTSFNTMHVNFKIHGSDVLITGLKKAPENSHTSKAQVVTLRHPCVLYMENGKTGMIISQEDPDRYKIHCFLETSHAFVFAVALSAIAES